MKNGFNSEPAYNEKDLKTKIKSCGGNMNINFHGDKLTKEGFQRICLPVHWLILFLKQVKIDILKYF